MNKNLQTLINSFRVDLSKLPNDNCVEDEEFNEIKNTTKFVLLLDKLEFDIFNKLILYLGRDGKTTYEFNSSPISQQDLDIIEKTTNYLYEILKGGTGAGPGNLELPTRRRF